jgi:hypothetical protein
VIGSIVLIVVIIVIVCCVCGKCKREQGVDVTDSDVRDSDASDGHVHVHVHEDVDDFGGVHVSETVTVTNNQKTPSLDWNPDMYRGRARQGVPPIIQIGAPTTATQNDTIHNGYVVPDASHRQSRRH